MVFFGLLLFGEKFYWSLFFILLLGIIKYYVNWLIVINMCCVINFYFVC